MPIYKVKVTYKYSDTLEVKAKSREEALAIAPIDADEQFECLYDCEIISETE